MKVKKDVPLTVECIELGFFFFFPSELFGWLVCGRGWFDY